MAIVLVVIFVSPRAVSSIDRRLPFHLLTLHGSVDLFYISSTSLATKTPF